MHLVALILDADSAAVVPGQPSTAVVQFEACSAAGCGGQHGTHLDAACAAHGGGRQALPGYGSAIDIYALSQSRWGVHGCHTADLADRKMVGAGAAGSQATSRDKGNGRQDRPAVQGAGRARQTECGHIAAQGAPSNEEMSLAAGHAGRELAEQLRADLPAHERQRAPTKKIDEHA